MPSTTPLPAVVRDPDKICLSVLSAVSPDSAPAAGAGLGGESPSEPTAVCGADAPWLDRLKKAEELAARAYHEAGAAAGCARRVLDAETQRIERIIASNAAPAAGPAPCAVPVPADAPAPAAAPAAATVAAAAAAAAAPTLSDVPAERAGSATPAMEVTVSSIPTPSARVVGSPPLAHHASRPTPAAAAAPAAARAGRTKPAAAAVVPPASVAVRRSSARTSTRKK